VQQALTFAAALTVKYDISGSSGRRGTKVTYWNYSGTVFHSACVRLLSADQFDVAIAAIQSTPSASNT